MTAIRYSDYDSFAWIYNKHWGYFSRQVLPVLEKLMLKDLPAEAHILDLCCDTGQLAQLLISRGYKVTGLDGSEEMIRLARENAPDAEFIVADARSFKLPPVYHGVVSTFDSLNHIMSLRELRSVFCNVHAILRKGGIFLFDLNMEEGYKARWHGSFGIVEEDHVCVIRSSYRQEERIGQCDITIFRLEDGWQRSDITLLQKCYSEEDIRLALETVSFMAIQAYDAQRGLEAERSAEVGRIFFLCRKYKYLNDSWVNPKVEVRESSLGGKGMFATEPIKAEEIVIIWGGKIFTEDEIKTGKARRGSISAIDEGVYLAGSADEGADIADFTNHSCDPNLWMQDEVTLVARRDIQPEEELTADYAMWEADENWVAKWECNCGSPLCRKRITGKDWRLPELQERYKGHFSPFLNRRMKRW